MHYGVDAKCQCIRSQIKGLRTEHHRQTPIFQLRCCLGANPKGSNNSLIGAMWPLKGYLPLKSTSATYIRPAYFRRLNDFLGLQMPNRVRGLPFLPTEQSGPNPSDLPFSRTDPGISWQILQGHTKTWPLQSPGKWQTSLSWSKYQDPMAHSNIVGYVDLMGGFVYRRHPYLQRT